MTETEARLNSHEAVCALRYEQINARLKRLEGVILKVCGVLLVSMAGMIWALTTKVTPLNYPVPTMTTPSMGIQSPIK